MMVKKNNLTHFNEDGNAHMVNIGNKIDSERQAITEGYIHLLPQTLTLIEQQGHKKGDVLQVARLAGMMAAKKTADIIPLCHPIAITHIDIAFDIIRDVVHDIGSGSNHEQSAVRCEVICKTVGKTGIEIEALVACSTALMTIYDMCKSVDRGMTINGVRLLQKSGGSSGNYLSDDVVQTL